MFGLFERNFPNCGVYLLREVDGQLVCMESFSSLSSNIEDNDLLAFVKETHIDEIFIDEQIDLPPEISRQIEACGLPTNNFNRSL